MTATWSAKSNRTVSLLTLILPQSLDECLNRHWLIAGRLKFADQLKFGHSRFESERRTIANPKRAAEMHKCLEGVDDEEEYFVPVKWAIMAIEGTFCGMRMPARPNGMAYTSCSRKNSRVKPVVVRRP